MKTYYTPIFARFPVFTPTTTINEKVFPLENSRLGKGCFNQGSFTPVK